VVEVFEREMRDLARTPGTSQLDDQRSRRNVKPWVDKITGMCHTHLELDPEADAKIASVFDAAVSAGPPTVCRVTVRHAVPAAGPLSPDRRGACTGPISTGADDRSGCLVGTTT
jgi:hypothetical protein